MKTKPLIFAMLVGTVLSCNNDNSNTTIPQPKIEEYKKEFWALQPQFDSLIKASKENSDLRLSILTDFHREDSLLEIQGIEADSPDRKALFFNFNFKNAQLREIATTIDARIAEVGYRQNELRLLFEKK